MFSSQVTHIAFTCSCVRFPDTFVRKVSLEGQMMTATLNALRIIMLCRSARTLLYAYLTAVGRVSYVLTRKSNHVEGILFHSRACRQPSHTQNPETRSVEWYCETRSGIPFLFYLFHLYSTSLCFISPEPDMCQFIFFSASITSFCLLQSKTVLGVSHRRDLPSGSPHPASPVFDSVHVLTSESHQMWRMTLQHPNSLHVTNDGYHTEQLRYLVKHLQYHIQLVWRWEGRHFGSDVSEMHQREFLFVSRLNARNKRYVIVPTQ